MKAFGAKKYHNYLIGNLWLCNVRSNWGERTFREIRCLSLIKPSNLSAMWEQLNTHPQNKEIWVVYDNENVQQVPMTTEEYVSIQVSQFLETIPDHKIITRLCVIVTPESDNEEFFSIYRNHYDEVGLRHLIDGAANYQSQRVQNMQG